MLEKTVIAHASPTLARLKLGSLFSISLEEGLHSEIARLSDLLEPKGVRITVLREKDGRALVYLYRENELERSLSCPMIREFLRQNGYHDFTLGAVIDRLRIRLEESDEFPHEIGVFLGYPLSDVIDFIRNDGKNCLCCGCWKVYSNECEALRSFARFRKCKEVYGRLFASGCPLSKLTVRSRTA